MMALSKMALDAKEKGVRTENENFRKKRKEK